MSGHTMDKMSCDPMHPDFHPDWWRARVYLNGELLDGCVHANALKGTAHVRAREGRHDLVLRRGNVCIWVFDDDIGED